jgi:DNA invertase Pin-like site-specific DNA recombinase
VRLHWHRGRARPLPRRRGRGEPRQISHVAGFKGSRLACSRRDWCQLLEICTFAGTLIAGSGVYDPTLLALKGTISEAELHIMWARLGEGRWNKACRGELRFNMPRDHPKHSQGEVPRPDERVRDAAPHQARHPSDDGGRVEAPGR